MGNIRKPGKGAKLLGRNSRQTNNTDVESTEITSFVNARGVKESEHFTRNYSKYLDFVSWGRWNPDLFFDLITPETGGIRLDLDQRIFMRCISRFMSVYGVFPRGYGKCVTAETIVATSKGLVEIGSLFDYEHGESEKLKIVNIDVVNRDGNVVNSPIGVYSGIKKTYKIITEDGYELEGTSNHRIIKKTNKGDNWCALWFVEIGDQVGIYCGADIWGRNYALRASVRHGRKSIMPREKMQVWKNSTLKFSTFLSERIARIFGYFMSRSCNIKVRSIHLENPPDCLMELLGIWFEKLGGVDKITTNTRDGINHVKITNYPLVIYLDKNDVVSCEAERCVPKCIMNSYKEFVANFIQGLFTYDAEISDQGIYIESPHEKLFKQVQIILLNFGIFSTRRVTKVDNFSSPVYSILIKEPYVGAFLDLIGFDDAKKTEKARSIIKNPYVAGEKKVVHSKVERRFIGEAPVYDINVPDGNSFIANGFINHNTLIEIMSMYCACIFYPDLEISMSAQSKENARRLMADKHYEIIRFYPAINDEIIKSTFAKDEVMVLFTSGSRITNVANQQTSKGLRRHRLNIEESNLLDNELFQDVIEPIPNVPRRTIGKKALINPDELNGQINFFTTSGFKGTDEYLRNIKMLDEMADLGGKIVIGADWQLPCEYGRGETRSQILSKKDNNSPISFAMNYGSEWVGAVDGALVNMNKLLNQRTMTTPEIKAVENGEYYLSMDVARSNKDNNNHSCIAVLKVVRNPSGRVRRVLLVNLITLPNGQTFEAQAIILKKWFKTYDARVVCIDGVGLGKGLVDELVKEHVDRTTGKVYPCYGVINKEIPTVEPVSRKCVFVIESMGKNTDIIVNFINYVEGGKLQLLEERRNFTYKDEKYVDEEVMPFVETELFVEEISNLKIKNLTGGNMTVERIAVSVDKDRYSAVAYGLWYIANFEDSAIQKVSIDSIVSAMKYRKGNPYGSRGLLKLK